MEIMKLFKKALLATAIFGAMGAQAADVSDAVKLTSSEGFAVSGVTGQPSVRAIVRQKLEAGDQIKLTFGAGLDLSGLTTVIVGQAPTVTAGNLGIDTGTATFEVEYLAADSDLAKGIIVLEVKTGYTIELDESFEIIADAGLFKSTASTSNSTVTYSATSWIDGSAKDTAGDNTGTFLRLASQYAAEVKTLLDGVVERKDQDVFISGQSDSGTGAGDNEEDSIVFTVTDRQDYVGAIASATDVSASFVITGDFSDIASGDLVASAATGSILVGDVTAVVAADEKSATITVVDDAAGTGTVAINGIAGTFTINIDNATRLAIPEKIKASKFVANAKVDFDGAGTITNTTLLTNANAGEWMLDATIINVPYFPVGFEGLSTSVHFANESKDAVDVIITAIDQAGNEYSSDKLADLAAKTVTKVSQVEVMSLLGAPAGSKLSITFNIDADDGDVNAYAFSNAGTGRQALVTSQEKGIK
jgi:hypothetical protein